MKIKLRFSLCSKIADLDIPDLTMRLALRLCGRFARRTIIPRARLAQIRILVHWELAARVERRTTCERACNPTPAMMMVILEPRMMHLCGPMKLLTRQEDSVSILSGFWDHLSKATLPKGQIFRPTGVPQRMLSCFNMLHANFLPLVIRTEKLATICSLVITLGSILRMGSSAASLERSTPRALENTMLGLDRTCL